ncbi:MAG: hypothetical protein KDD62_16005, partial [Bdellovibrionales bacterium]|nr:hypothetical protein [Bdellovibrionales bacterium]
MDEKQGSNQESANILKSVGIYYSEKISSHGATPAGVDWNGEESQTERFHQLLKIVTERSPFS